MATTKEIKNRIKSVQDTKKITNAMYLISSTKMRKAKKEMEATKPYFDMLRHEIRRMFSVKCDADSPYFSKDGIPGIAPTDSVGILVITADKGLAGAYNQNVIKDAINLIGQAASYKLWVVGEYGRHYFLSHGYEVERSFLYTAQSPTLDRARRIMNVLLESYSNSEVDEIYVCYTDFENGMSGGTATDMELLPFNTKEFKTGNTSTFDDDPHFEYYPDVESVLNNIVPSYFSGFIYSALVDSFCSEQNARMIAMDAANDNAEELLGQLSLEYNHVRQGAITQEITEISSGARGQRMAALKRKKKEEE